MYFAQFYQFGAVSGKPIEACGDRSVIILDGRESRASHNGIALVECRARGYVGYSLHKGSGFNRDVSTLAPLYVLAEYRVPK